MIQMIKFEMLPLLNMAFLSVKYELHKLERMHYSFLLSKDKLIRQGAVDGYKRVIHDQVEKPKHENVMDWYRIYPLFIDNLYLHCVKIQQLHGVTLGQLKLKKYLLAYTWASELEKNNVKVLLEKAVVLYSLKLYKESLKDLLKAIAFEKKNSAIQKEPSEILWLLKFWLAMNHYSLKNYKNIDSLTKEILYLEPWDIKTCILRYKILKELGKKKEANELKSRIYLLDDVPKNFQKVDLRKILLRFINKRS